MLSEVEHENFYNLGAKSVLDQTMKRAVSDQDLHYLHKTNVCLFLK